MLQRPPAYHTYYAPLVAIIDFLLVLASGFGTHFLRFGLTNPVPQDFIVLIFNSAILVVLCLNMGGIYRSWRGVRLQNILTRYITVLLAPVFLVLLFLVFTKTSEKFSRLWLIFFFNAVWISGVVYRVGHFYFLKWLRSQGHNLKNVIVISLDLNSLPLNFREDALDSGYNTVKFIPVFDPEGELNLADLPTHIRKLRAEEIWLCLPISLGGIIKDVMYTLRKYTVDIRYLPDFEDMQLLNHRPGMVAGRYSLDLSYTPLDGTNATLKRLEDIILGFIILITILPACAVIAVLVKLSSPGPVLFKQKRHGIGGKPIKVYKFRTMKIHEEPEGAVTQATKDDPRTTAIGRYLRRTSLDELPQFYNVLQGRMSIVGPRPHALAHNEYYMDLVESYMWRHKVKPGITGLAQVNGYRGETDTLEKMQKRVEYDLSYINNWSLLLDLKIILLTVIKGFTNHNAY